jgi:hypothetical protein
MDTGISLAQLAKDELQSKIARLPAWAQKHIQVLEAQKALV